MDAQPFLHVRSAGLRILPGEDQELVNEGTYGKACALYLQAQLTARGYAVLFFTCEDWGTRSGVGTARGKLRLS